MRAPTVSSLRSAGFGRPRPPLARRSRRVSLRLLRRSSVVFWLAAVVLAGVAASAVASSTGAGDDAMASGDTTRVPVAVGDFGRGHRLAPSDVDWRQLPDAAVPKDPASMTEGRVVIEPIAEGEVIAGVRLGPDGVDGTAALLPPGTRAIAIPLSLGAPPLEIGDRVDLLAAIELSASNAAGGAFGTGGGRPVARDAVVVAVEDEAVTVAVDEDDADDTVVALTSGAVILALVSPE